MPDLARTLALNRGVTWARCASAVAVAVCCVCCCATAMAASVASQSGSATGRRVTLTLGT
jgi:hypothetical protein